MSSIPARCGRRTSSGSTCPGGSTPTGPLGIRRWFESAERPGTPVGVDEYYSAMFAESVPGLAEAAAAVGQSPLEYMRDRGAFEIDSGGYAPYERAVDASEVAGCVRDDRGVYRRPGTAGAWDGDPAALAEVRLDPSGDGSPAVEVGGEPKAGFPTPSKKLELFSTTLADWGWRSYASPWWIPSHVHWRTWTWPGASASCCRRSASRP